MLFKLVGKLLKNLKWIIPISITAIGAFYAYSQYTALQKSPVGVFLPQTNPLQDILSKITDATKQPEETPIPTPTEYPKNIKVVIETESGEVIFSVETAITQEERNLGLMFRESIPQYGGMFFVHESDIQYGYWMKNCEFPQDMIFINASFEIVDIKENVPPCKIADPEQNACPSYIPKSQYRYVLEINGGGAKLNGIQSGQKVIIK